MILLTGCAGKSDILSRVWEYSPITRAKQAGMKSSPALAASPRGQESFSFPSA